MTTIDALLRVKAQGVNVTNTWLAEWYQLGWPDHQKASELLMRASGRKEGWGNWEHITHALKKRGAVVFDEAIYLAQQETL